MGFLDRFRKRGADGGSGRGRESEGGSDAGSGADAGSGVVLYHSPL